MNYKYKVGDKVFVRDDLIVGKKYKMDGSDGDSDGENIFVSSMKYFKGKQVTIETISRGQYRIKESGFYWTDEMFEPAKKMKPIVIYKNGRKVIALDKNTGNKGTAECSPDDPFDFYTGARLAFDRLTETGTEFKLGDILVALPDTPYAITDNGWVGKVVKLEDNGCITLRGLSADKSRLISFYGLEPKYFRPAKDEDLTPELLRKIWICDV